MLDFARTIVASLIVAAATSSPPPESQAPQDRSPSEILASVAQRGEALLSALRNYSYFSELTIETVSQSDTVTGKYYRFTQVSFDPEGKRQEKVLEQTSTLPVDVTIGATTANNLTRIYQFVVTRETLIRYDLNYVGRERVDELDTFVFDVNPKIKVLDSDKSDDRYLKGRVWIDQQDLCVVKVSGQALPAPSSHRTPKFETYFQNHDEFWFPGFASADDSIKIGRYVTRIVVKLRFTGYKKVSAR